jgi:hypothetical protein
MASLCPGSVRLLAWRCCGGRARAVPAEGRMCRAVGHGLRLTTKWEPSIGPSRPTAACLDARDAERHVLDTQRGPSVSSAFERVTQGALMSGQRLKAVIAVTSVVAGIVWFGATPASACGNSCYDQVGAYPGSATTTDTARMTMDEPGNLIKGSDIYRFYWPGVTFPNGYFYQAGYMDRADSCTGFQTFTTRLTPAGNFVDPSNPYSATHCGLTGQHTFKVAIASETENTITWQFYMDGDPIGSSLAFPNREQ